MHLIDRRRSRLRHPAGFFPVLSFAPASCFFLLFSVVGLVAAGRLAVATQTASPESLDIQDSGYRRVFELAQDEACVVGPTGERELKKLPPLVDPSGIVQSAEPAQAMTGGEGGLVLYEKNVRRTEYTRRILTKRVLVHLDNATDPSELAQSRLFRSEQRTGHEPGLVAQAFGVRWLDNAFNSGVLGRGRMESAVKPAQSKSAPGSGGFMESLHAERSAHWDHEPVREALTPSLSHRMGEGVRRTGEGRFIGNVEVVSIKAVPYAPGFFVLEAKEAGAALRMAAALRLLPGVRSADPILGKKQSKKSVPNDPLFDHQWHLLDAGQTGLASKIDLNVTNVWEKYRGQGITIAVVDDGLQPTHPDLVSNIISQLGHDYRDGDADPSSGGNDDYHGTQVAGVAAARGNNAVGIAGVAYEASLASIRLVGGNDQTDEQNAASMLHSNQVIQVSNNSWGASDDGETLDGPGTLMKLALQDGARNGRGGKGTIFVWPSGNGRQTQDNANYDGYANSIYTIAVGALNSLGQQASFSEPGACLVVAAPAGVEGGADERGILTTDLAGEGGQNHSAVTGDSADRDYTQRFGGTSAVTPMVAGVSALLLQANPTLGWRDVQEILLRSAFKVDAADADWMTNGFGLHFNHKYGAGLVDADAAVNLATRWINLGAHTNIFLEQTNLAEVIPDNTPAGITRAFDLNGLAPLRVEHVTVTVNITHSRRGDLAITLISPSGTRSRLTEKHLDANENYPGWPLMSVFNWGEPSPGRWVVQIADIRLNRSGTLNSIRVDLFGTAEGTEGRPTIAPLGFDDKSRFRMLLQGRAGAAYEVQASSNLLEWAGFLQTTLSSNLAIEVLDPGTDGFSTRFYRAVRRVSNVPEP